jgi:lactate racemase
MCGDAWVFCGTAHLPVPRADRHVPPAELSPLPDLEAALAGALAGPLGAPGLRALAAGARTVAVAVPDSSRPCPSRKLLPPLLAELRAAGVSDGQVRVVVGCGVHAPTSAAERDDLLGREVCDRHEVVDGHGIESPVVHLGRTSLGVPVEIVRTVAEADLTICLGVVEPHLYAGFSGGVKGVAIGCAGLATITATHRPSFISQPGVALAELDGNPFRETLLEIAERTSLRWAVNVVVDERGRAAAVAAGDPALVQQSLAARHRPTWVRPLEGAYDVVVAGVPAPKSDNLYQASRAATYVGLAASPALADGGLLVLCADLPDGAGAGPGERNFLSLLSQAPSPARLVARGLHGGPLGPGGQRSFVVARVLERSRLAVVGAHNPAFLAPLEHLGIAAFDSVDAAVAAAEARLGRRARVAAVADAMSTIVHAGFAPRGRRGERG